ncbi:MAG: 6-carboxytetrahydropterin synthase QueD [Desulfobacteraceae bacterium]|nr:MAG: 6-carboxytetrahydropterin synthase QueD [Desulfobacteraceae bacterium]
MFELRVVTRFAAAHQLKMVAEKCENLHGHNWKIEVYIAGDSLNSAGVLMDFGEIKKRVAEVMKSLDHRFLNELECFEGNPSSERIAAFIAQALQQSFTQPGVRIRRVTAWESEDASATYYPT